MAEVNSFPIITTPLDGVAVRYDSPQNIPDDGQLQARDNIGAQSASDVSSAVEGALSGYIVGTRSVAETQSIPAPILSVRTTGFADIGDGGGELYKRVESEPSHAGKFQSDDGAWWEIAPAGAVNARSLGAKGDAVRDGGGVWTGTDDTASLKDWESVGHALGIPRYLPRGNYIITDEIVDGVQRDDVLIYGDGAASVIIPKHPNSKVWHYLGGRDSHTAANIYLTSSAAQGSGTLEINSTSTLSVDQYIVIKDNSQPIYDNQTGQPQVATLGEINKVKSIDSETQITLYKSVEFDYGSNVTPSLSTTLHRFTSPCRNLRFRDFAVAWDSGVTYTAGEYIIHLQRAINVDVSNVIFTGPQVGQILMFDTIHGRVRDCRTIKGKNEDHLGSVIYTVAATRASCDIIVDGYQAEGGRHLITTGSTGGDIETSHGLVTNCIGFWFEAATFDTHAATRDWEFRGNQAVGQLTDLTNETIPGWAGFQLRGRRNSAIDNKIVARTTGVYLAHGSDNRAQGNRIYNCATGIRNLRTGRGAIERNKIYDPVNRGIWTELHGYPEDFDYPALRWVDNEVFGDPSICGFDIDFTLGQAWRDDWVLEGNRFPDAATKYDADTPGRARLAQGINVIAHSGVASPQLTGTTAETALATINLPALGPNDAIRVTYCASYNNDADDKILRVRLGGISGTVHVTHTQTTSASVNGQVLISNRGVMNSQIGRNSAVIASFGQGSGPNTTGSIDTSVEQTLLVTGQLEDGTDNMTLESYLVELIVV